MGIKRQKIKKVLLVIFCINFLSSQSLLAKELRLTEARNLRISEDSQMTVVGRLAAGSIIDIPDEYVVAPHGKFDFDASVKLWSTAMKDKKGDSPILAKFSGSKKDYFIPIKIVEAAPGSRIKNKTDPVMISVRDVAVLRDGQKVEMKTTLATDVLGAKISEIEARDAKIAANSRNLKFLEADANPASIMPCLSCGADGPVTQVAKLGTQIKPQEALQQKPLKRQPLEQKSEAKKQKAMLTAQEEYDQMSENFQNTCHMHLDDFTKVISEKVKGTLFRTEHLLAIMWKESKGVCFPNSATGTAEKHGLFGIQDANSTISEGVCTNSQKAALHKTVASNANAFEKFSHYKSDPGVNCVGNPFLNLDASIRILGVKKDMIKGPIHTDIVDGEPKLNMQSLFPVLFNYNGNRKQAFKTVKTSKRGYSKKVALGESVQHEYAKSSVIRVQNLIEVFDSAATSSIASGKD